MSASRLLPPALTGKKYLWKVFRDLVRGRASVLSRNLRFHDTFRGKRCFVLGSGPSAKKVDLTRLRGQHVLTVNALMYHMKEYGIVPLAHSLMDPWYFDGRDPSFKDLHFFVEGVDSSIEFFFPLEYRNVVERIVPKARLDRVNYLGFSGWYPENRNAELTRHLPRVQTVTIAPALIALWMGFSEIYLLGCDCDWLSHVVGVRPLRVRNRNFYDEKDEPIEVGDGFTYTTYVEAIAKMLRGFEHVQESVRPGQKVMNAGEGSLLDMFEPVSFDSLFPPRNGATA